MFVLQAVDIYIYQIQNKDDSPTKCTLSETCLIDDENPTLVEIPNDIIRNATNGEAIVTWDDPMFSDNSGSITLTSSHNSGSLFTIGTTRVIYTATDPAGNTVNATFNVIVQGKYRYE